MSVTELLSELARKGVQVTLDGDQVRFRGPKHALTPELIGNLTKRKPEILSVFQKAESRRKSLSLPISRADRNADIPLSEVQRELWMVEQLSAGPSARVVTAAIRITGALNAALLERSIAEVARRHESLRTTFEVRDGQPVQNIHAEVPPDAMAERWKEFDLKRGPLFRTRLESLSATGHTLYVAAHHLIFDVDSVWIFFREIAGLYNSNPVPALPLQYADFAAWRPASDEAHVEYWTRRLQGAPSILELPTDRPRDSARHPRSLREEAQFSATLTAALRNVAKDEGVTPFVFLLSVFSLLLARYSGQDDILIGSPVSGRVRPELEGLIGSFAYPLVIRADLSGSCTFRDLLLRLRDTTIGAFEHQDVPFGRVIEAAQPERRPGTSPLFQVMFTYPRGQGSIEISGLTFEPITEQLRATVEYDLFLSAVESGDALDLALTYADDLFEPETIVEMLRRLVEIVQSAIDDPGQPIAQCGAGASAVTVEHQGLGPAPAGVAAEIFIDGKPTGERGRLLRSGEIESLGGIHALAATERAILGAPSVADCAVLQRGSERIAYVVPAGQLAIDDVVSRAGIPSPAIVPVSHIPLTAKGTVDTEALARLPVIDARLIEASSGETIVLAARDNVAPLARLHLSDLLPSSEQFGEGRTAQANPVDSRRATEDEIARRPWALSDGGPLTIPPDAPKTFTEAILRTAKEHSDNGVVFVGLHGEVTRLSWAELLADAKRILAGLQAAGFRPHDRVILQVGELPDHFAAFWACVLAGVVPVTVAVSATYEERTGIVNKLYNTWELLGKPAILANASLVPSLEGLTALLPMDGLRVLAVESLRQHGSSEAIHQSRPEDLVFFQLSSGSTGTPKCIQETHRAIIAHIHGSQQFNGYREDDVNLNWLPVDHVVPILTCHLKDAYIGCSEIQVRTGLILASPEKWLDLTEEFRVTHSWAPNFGFKLVTDALKTLRQRTWDLSSLKFLMNAGEQVTAAVVRDFLNAVAPFGVRTEAMQPAFGMAEACTCMTYRNGFDLQTGHRRILKSTLPGALLETAGDDEISVSFVDLGPPVAGIQIRITDSSNQLVREGFIGRFQIKGPVITPGYLCNEEANREAFVGDGWFNTGDIGFIMEGSLFLTGREKETIRVRGSNFYCYEVEDVVNAVEGVETTFSAACGIPDAISGTEELGIFFVPKADSIAVIAAIRTRVARELGISPAVIVPLDKKDFPKTTSGKIQRTQLKKSLEAGHFDGLLKEIDLRLANANTLPDWFFRRIWRLRPASVSSVLPASVLVLGDNAGLADSLIALLKARGVDCRTSADFAGDGTRIDLIIDLRAYLPAAEIACQSGTLDLLDLAHALQEFGSRVGSPALLVARAGLANASLPALLRTMPREIPWLRCRYVELEVEDTGANAQRLMDELCPDDPEAEITYRGGRRLATRLQKISHPSVAQAHKHPFKRGGAYLISGGLGGLGAGLAKFLLQRYDCRLLLVGRTERPELLESLRLAGGEVRFAKADICEAEALKAAALDWNCELDGVIHLAGVLRESALADESRESFADSLRAKVQGALALHELVKDKPGTLFIHFSSVNGFFGGFRAGAYSAASGFLDRFAAYQREACGLRAWSLAWSMWDEIGMSRGYPFKELSQSRGFMTIGLRQGLQSLIIALRQEASNVIIGLDRTRPDVRVHVETKPWGLTALRGWHATASPVPQIRDRFGVPVPCDFLEVPREALADRAGLMRTAQPERTTQPGNELEQTIARLWKELLNVPEVGVNENFFDLGGHSMLLMQVHGRLTQSLGRDFAMVDLLSHPTIATLAAHLGQAAGTDQSLRAGQSRADARKQALARKSARA